MPMKKKKACPCPKKGMKKGGAKRAVKKGAKGKTVRHKY